MLRAVPPQDVPRKVVAGKDGWLFLDYDTNQIMAQHTGRLRFRPEDLERWRAVLEARIEWLEQHGAHYLFVVVPDAPAVFPDKLPDHLTPVAQRPLVQLRGHLRDSGSRAEVVYPIEELAGEHRHVTYPKTETHWTDWGAFLAYRAVLQRVRPLVPVREVKPEDVVVHESWEAGDLGATMDPPMRSLHAFVEVRAAAARFVSDNRVMNRGRRIEYTCEAAPDVCCLVLGDSYAASFVHVLAETFGRVVLGYVPTLDRDLVAEVRPDVVIQETAERFLIAPPDDTRDMTLAQWEVTKRAQGKVYGARLPDQGNRVQSAMP